MKNISEQFSFSCVQPDDFDVMIDATSNLITEALEYADGKYKLDDVKQGIRDRKMQLWLVTGAKGDIYSACVTEVVEYPSKRLLCILFVAGKHMPVWIHFMETLKDFAKRSQCVAIEEYGRPGWRPYLAKLGFEKIHDVLRLNL